MLACDSQALRQNIALQPCKCTQSECTSTGSYYAEITLPVELKPAVVLGKIEAICCGDPEITKLESVCANKVILSVKQKICIKIPATYKICACSGESQISCGEDNPCGK